MEAEVLYDAVLELDPTYSEKVSIEEFAEKLTDESFAANIADLVDIDESTVKKKGDSDSISEEEVTESTTLGETTPTSSESLDEAEPPSGYQWSTPEEPAPTLATDKEVFTTQTAIQEGVNEALPPEPEPEPVSIEELPAEWTLDANEAINEYTGVSDSDKPLEQLKDEGEKLLEKIEIESPEAQAKIKEFSALYDAEEKYNIAESEKLRKEEKQKGEAKEKIRQKSINESVEFNKDLNDLTIKDMEATEEVLVPALNERYKKYGLIFQETGVGDRILASDAKGNTLDLKVGRATTKEYQLETLQKFITNHASLDPTFAAADKTPAEKEYIDFMSERGLNGMAIHQAQSDLNGLTKKLEIAERMISEEGFLEAYSQKDIDAYPDLFVKSSVGGKEMMVPRTDLAEKVATMQEERDKIEDLVGVNFFQDDILVAQEDFDVYAAGRRKEVMKEYAETNKAATEAGVAIDEEALAVFGKSYMELKPDDIKTQEQLDVAKRLYQAQGDAQVLRKTSADLWLDNKTFLDLQQNRAIMDEFDDAWLGAEGVKNEIMKGLNQGSAAQEILLLSMGINDVKNRGDIKEAAESIVRNLMEKEEYGTSRAQHRLNMARGVGQSAKAFFKDPLELGASLFTNSMSSMLPYGWWMVGSGTLGGAVTGGTLGSMGLVAGPTGLITTGGAALTGAAQGFRLSMAAAMFAMEYTNSILDVMREKGYDMMKPDEVAKGLQDHEVWRDGSSRGIKRGIPIAVIDYISAGMAGKLFGKGTHITSGVSRRVGMMGTEQVVWGPGMEMVGEAGAQFVAGQNINLKEIMMEGFGSSFGNVSNLTYNTYKMTNKNAKKDYAEGLTDINAVLKDNVNLENLSNWSANMEMTGQIDAETNAKIQENIGTKRDVKEIMDLSVNTTILGATLDGRQSSNNIKIRLGQLLDAKKQYETKKEVFGDEISAIKKEIQEITSNNQLVEKPLALPNTQTIYKVNGKTKTKGQMVRYLAKATPEQLVADDIDMKNAPAHMRERLIEVETKIKENAISESSTTGVDVQEQTTDGGTVGKGDTQVSQITKTETQEEGQVPAQDTEVSQESEAGKKVKGEGHTIQYGKDKDGAFKIVDGKRETITDVTYKLETKRLGKLGADVTIDEKTGMTKSFTTTEGTGGQRTKLGEVVAAVETVKDAADIGSKDSYDVVVEDKKSVLEDTKGEARLQVEEDTETFKSTALEGMDKIQQKTATPDQWVKQVQEKGGKGTKAEIEDMGLKEFLDDYQKENNTKSVPKKVVEDYIRENTITIEEVELKEGGKDREGRMTYDKREEMEGYISFIDGLMAQKEIEVNSNVTEDKYRAIMDSDKVSKEDKALLTEQKKGVDESMKEGTQYHDYKIPGEQTNYREVLLKTPPQGLKSLEQLDAEERSIMAKVKKRRQDSGYDSKYTKIKDAATKEQYERLNEIADEKKAVRDKSFMPPHFTGHTNIAAHIRMSDRKMPDGEKVLFIEEMQSDWAQGGRKKGFGPTKVEQKKIDKAKAKMEKSSRKAALLWDEAGGKDGTRITDIEQKSPEFKEAQKESEAAYEEFRDAEAEVSKSRQERKIEEGPHQLPDTPYKSTDKWAGLAVRNILKMAEKEGYDRIAFATGDQIQAAVGGEIRGQRAFYNKLLPKIVQAELKRIDPDSKIEVVDFEQGMTESGRGNIYETKAIKETLSTLQGAILKAKKRLTQYSKLDRKAQLELTMDELNVPWAYENVSVKEAMEMLEEQKALLVDSQSELRRTHLNALQEDLKKNQEAIKEGKEKRKGKMTDSSGKLLPEAEVPFVNTVANASKESGFETQTGNLPISSAMELVEEMETEILNIKSDIEGGVSSSKTIDRQPSVKLTEKAKEKLKKPVPKFQLKEEGGKDTQSDIDTMVSKLKKVFPNVNVATTKEAFDNVLKEEGVREKKVGGQTILGITKDGNVWINPEAKSISTPIHEFGHLWTDFLRSKESGTKGTKLLNQGMKLIEGTQAYTEALKKYGKYKDGKLINENLVKEEALVEMIATKGESIANKGKRQAFKKWMDDMYRYIKKHFKTTKELQEAEIDALTLEEFKELALGDLFAGKPLDTKTGTKEGAKSQPRMRQGTPQFTPEQEAVAEFINNKRDEGYTDADLKPMLKKEFSDLTAEQIDQSLEVDAGLFYIASTEALFEAIRKNLPEALKNVYGGAKAGKEMLTSIEDALTRVQAKRNLTPIQRRNATIRLLKSIPKYKTSTTTQQKDLITQIDDLFGIDEGKTLNARMKELRKQIVQRRQGKGEVKKEQNLLRKIIKDLYPDAIPAGMNQLMAAIKNLTTENIKSTVDKVRAIANKKLAEMKKEKISAIRKMVKDNAKLKTTKSNRPEGNKKVSAQGQKFFAAAEVIMDALAITDPAQRKIALDIPLIKMGFKPKVIYTQRVAPNGKPIDVAETFYDPADVPSAIADTIESQALGYDLTTQENQTLDMIAAHQLLANMDNLDYDQVVEISETLGDLKKGFRQELLANVMDRARKNHKIEQGAIKSVVDNFGDMVMSEDNTYQKINKVEQEAYQDVAIEEFENSNPKQYVDANGKKVEGATEAYITLPPNNEQIKVIKQERTDAQGNALTPKYNIYLLKPEVANDQEMARRNASLDEIRGMSGIPAQLKKMRDDFLKNPVAYINSGIQGKGFSFLQNVNTMMNLMDNVGDFFTKNVSKRLNKMTSDVDAGIVEQFKKMDEIANKVYVMDKYKILKKYNTKGLRGILSLDVVRKYHKITMKDGTEQKFTGSQLMRMYALSLNDKVRDKMATKNKPKDALTEEGIEQIREVFKDTGLIEYVENVVDYLSNEYFETVNDVYKKVNNVSLGHVENYFPLITDNISGKVDGKMLEDGDFFGVFSAQFATALKQRTDTQSGVVISGQGFFSNLENHFREMEKFKNMAEGVQDLNAALNNKPAQNAMKAMGVYNMTRTLINQTINPRAMNLSDRTVWDGLHNLFINYVLGMKVVQLIKQGSSFVLALEKYRALKNKGKVARAIDKTPLGDVIDLLSFTARMARILPRAGKYIKRAKALSPSFKLRYENSDLYDLESPSGISRSALIEPSHIFQDPIGWIKNAQKRAIRAESWFTKRGDAIGVLGYMAVAEQMKEDGATQEQIREGFEDYNETNQTRRTQDLTKLQLQRNFFVRTLTTFGSMGFLQIQKTVVGSRNIMRDISKGKVPKKQDVRAVALNAYLGNFLFHMAANSMTLLRGNEEDKEKAWARVQEGAFLSMITMGIPLVGAAISSGLKVALGAENPFKPSEQVNPYMQFSRRIYKYMNTPEWEKDQTELAVLAIGLGSGGINSDPFFGLYEFGKDFYDRDRREFVNPLEDATTRDLEDFSRMMGYPKSTRAYTYEAENIKQDMPLSYIDYDRFAEKKGKEEVVEEAKEEPDFVEKKEIADRKKYQHKKRKIKKVESERMDEDTYQSLAPLWLKKLIRKYTR